MNWHFQTLREFGKLMLGYGDLKRLWLNTLNHSGFTDFLLHPSY